MSTKRIDVFHIILHYYDSYILFVLPPLEGKTCAIQTQPKWELYSSALLEYFTTAQYMFVYSSTSTLVLHCNCLVQMLCHSINTTVTITVTIALLVLSCVCGFLLALTLLVMVIVLVTSLRQRKKIQQYKQLTTNEEI